MKLLALLRIYYPDALGGRGGDCRYNECANCLNSQDCGFNEVREKIKIDP